ncbi:MAG: hypothetical protein QM778_24520 [Myxococcales bacterium]
MRPLRNIDPAELGRAQAGEELDAATLLRARKLLGVLEPLADSPSRKHRVRAALAARGCERAASRRKTSLSLALVMVLALSALAAAQNLEALRELLSATNQVHAPTQTHDARHAHEKQAVSTLAEPPRGAVSEPVEDPSAAASTPAHSGKRTTRHAPAPRSPDTELVHQAVKALRRDHDPTRAAQLLESVYTRDPAGVLAEEVMSLRVEAAVARGDTRAKLYAKQYLARYPRGRYRAQVSNALAR